MAAIRAGRSRQRSAEALAGCVVDLWRANSSPRTRALSAGPQAPLWGLCEPPRGGHPLREPQERAGHVKPRAGVCVSARRVTTGQVRPLCLICGCSRGREEKSSSAPERSAQISSG